MRKKDYAWIALFMLSSSFLGGALSAQLFKDKQAFSPKRVPYHELFGAEKFLVRDGRGAIRAGLVFDPGPGGSPAMVLFDQEGRISAELRLLSNGSPGFTFYHETKSVPPASPTQGKIGTVLFFRDRGEKNRTVPIFAAPSNLHDRPPIN